MRTEKEVQDELHCRLKNLKPGKLDKEETDLTQGFILALQWVLGGDIDL